MRIGFDVSPITAARTGVGTFCYYQLAHLLQRKPDWDFHGFASGRSPIVLGPLEALAPYTHLRVPTRALYTVWNWTGRPRVDRLIGGADVYHATNFFLPPTQKAGRVVSIYDLSFMIVPQLCSPKIVGPFSKGVRRFVRQADVVLACSEATKQDIVTHLEISPEKVVVARGAVDESFHPMPRAEAEAFLAKHYDLRPPFLLFVGTIEPRKNLPGLLRAFGSLAKEIPHKLVLAGPVGWRTEETFRTLESLQLGDRIMRVGYVTHHGDLAAFYGAADAFVFPTFYEGFGLPLAEAMVCGCPVVTSPNSAVPEAAGDAALYADPADAEAIAGAIRRLLSEPGLREQCVMRGYEQVKKFTWDACADATIQAYRKAASCEC